jgi:O-antigen/teichoic acid export membrane protein
MLVAAPGLACFALNKVLFAILNGMQRMRAFAALQSCRFLGLLGGFFVALALGLPGEKIAFVLTFSEGVTFLGLAVEVGRNLAWSRRAAWRPWSGRHLAYGVKSFLSGVLLELNSRVDVLMIGWFHGDAMVGVYSFAAMIAEGVFQVLVKLQNNYNPVLAQHISSGRLDELATIVRRGKRVAWFLMLASALP